MQEESEERELVVRFAVPPDLPVYSVDGVFGAINHHGKLVASIYSEQVAFPDSITYAISRKEGVTSVEEKERAGSSGMTRNMHCSLVLDRRMTEALYIWLGDKLELWKRLDAIEIDINGEAGDAIA